MGVFLLRPPLEPKRQKSQSYEITEKLETATESTTNQEAAVGAASAGRERSGSKMDWIWSWKDTMFYGICTFSKTAGTTETDPVSSDKFDAPLRLKSYR
ncbi:hypothetical protein Q1695_012886 [Nippostrongylus brasiliensis]|nr:hypothetical protein Q1695_012886 [Nippostrongylus brasiliensis]